jgi:hypothetical protein
MVSTATEVIHPERAVRHGGAPTFRPMLMATSHGPELFFNRVLKV